MSYRSFSIWYVKFDPFDEYHYNNKQDTCYSDFEYSFNV